MNRVDRLFGILTLLQSKKYMTAQQIAAKFEISVRTVYRDIRAMEEQGIPVGFEPHRGYFVVQGYFLPPVSFSSEEANALLLMESIVRGFADKSIQLHYSNALNKIKAVLRLPQKEQLERLSDNIRMQVPACFELDFAYLSTLQDAIAHKRIIEIAYKNKDDEITQRRAEPIGLVFYALNWHLIAWCHQRQDYRDFRVSRIRQILCTGMPFTVCDHISLNKYMEQLPVDY